MPVVFIHGVNNRDDAAGKYRKDVAARDELIQRLLIEPLAEQDSRFEGLKVINPYWGKYGVEFYWDHASLPDVDTIGDLSGPDSNHTLQSDLEVTATLPRLAGKTEPLSGEVNRPEGLFKEAAQKDLPRFIETMLTPVILSEVDLVTNEPGETPEEVGVREALLTLAGMQVAQDVDVQQAISAAPNDEALIELLKQAVKTRYRALLEENQVVPGEDEEVGSLGFGPMARLMNWVGEVFDRSKDAPGRIATLPMSELFREGLHRNFSQFFGNVFIYLKERDSQSGPGSIITTIIESIKNAPRQHPDEPLIIITHSMGGNILYDILSYYAPDLKIDVWISVGTQVGQFEEMKLFKASDKIIRGPQKVGGIKPRVGYWVNIYDPADLMGFKTAPIFQDVDEDHEFLTGANIMKSHGAYFKRPTFYKLLVEHLTTRLQGAR